MFLNELIFGCLTVCPTLAIVVHEHGRFVQRGTCRFGRYKNPSPHTPSLTLAHLPTPALAPRRPLNQSTLAARVHFWPLVSTAVMGSHGGVVAAAFTIPASWSQVFGSSSNVGYISSPAGAYDGSCKFSNGLHELSPPIQGITVCRWRFLKGWYMVVATFYAIGIVSASILIQ